MFSVVIPTYKRDEDLEECLKSIRENSSMKIEIIVLHPGFETTHNVCKKYEAISILDNARSNGKRVKSLWTIINEGIRLASNQYVLYLNDDCLVLPNWDYIASNYFKNKKIGLLVLKTKGIGQDPQFQIINSLYYFPCANYAILNKQAQIYFDENYNWFWSDADIPLQFAISKYKIAITKENMVIHNHKVDETRKTNENTEQSNLDHLYFQNKWKDYKRIGNKLYKKNFVDIIIFKIKRRIKIYIFKINKMKLLLLDFLKSINSKNVRYNVYGYSGLDPKKYYYTNFFQDKNSKLILSSFKPHIRFFMSQGEYKTSKKIQKKRNKITIFITSENLHSNVTTNAKYYKNNCLDRTDLSVGFDYVTHSNYIRFPYWLERYFLPEMTYQDIKEKVNEFNKASYKKSKFCALVASHDFTGIRKNLLGLVNTIEKVSCPGNFMYNDNSLKLQYNDNKLEYLKDFMFNLCPENDSANGYVTEKIFDALCADTIPIYWGGDFLIEPDVLNQNYIINLNPNDYEYSLKQIKDLYTNKILYSKFKKQDKIISTAPDWIFEKMNEMKNAFAELINKKLY